MKNINDTRSAIITKVNELLNIKVVDTKRLPQGMDSDVFLVIDKNENEYAIKYGTGADMDVLAYNLFKANSVKVPTPKMFGNFVMNNKPVIVLERIKFPLLETVPINKMYRYILSMVENLKEIHKIKSDKAGYLSDQNKDLVWKDVFLSKFSGSDTSLNWSEISKRKGLNEKLILDSIGKMLEITNLVNFIDKPYSFLHTDFNQRNLFINPNSENITGIIDWGEAMFGDPIYDFARIRMYLWHFNLGDEAVDKYYKLLSYKPNERRLENLYWLSRVIEYLAYYSEELNKFNIGRIKLHQDFLINYDWNLIEL